MHYSILLVTGEKKGVFKKRLNIYRLCQIIYRDAFHYAVSNTVYKPWVYG
jgi:hypothetical protein